MSKIKILIYKEVLYFKKNIVQYIFLLFVLPFSLFLFLSIPFSKVFLDLKPVYSIWVCSGVLLVSVLFNIYLFNLNWFKKNYKNHFLKSIPITTFDYLVSQILFSIILGFSQYFVSVIVLNSLSIGFMSFMQCIKCFFILIPSIIIISNIALIASEFIKNQFILNILSYILFLFLTFSIGSFIPIDLYPIEYINVISYFPFSATLINIQNIISFETIYFSMFFISIFYFLFFLFIGYYIIESKIRN